MSSLFNINPAQEKKDEEYRQYKTKSNNFYKYPNDFNKPVKPWEKDKPVIIKPVEVKIHSVVMYERLDLCSKEDNLSRRVLMLERLRGQVERASVPYIDFLLRKTKSKMDL